ncbi:TonB-dependent receptor [candidate division KSB1 bacterium]|nr:TonB-dependent receptor [candidate division KSB1 bacterium]
MKHYQFIFLLIVVLYLRTPSLAQSLPIQPTTIIHGRVTDSTNNQPIYGVNVALSGAGIGTSTDADGYFFLNKIHQGTYSISVTHIGYESEYVQDVFVEENKNYTYNFNLKAKVLELKPVKVEADRIWEHYVADVSLVGVQRMKGQEIVNIPGAFDDPIRAVQIYSGVSGVGDFNSFLAVRGGSPDQNLVMLDGIVIPNPYRFRLAMGGGLSIFDPNITQDVHLSVGGFSAEYGNRLSSVFEVTTRTGSRDRFNFQGSINLTDASAVAEFPFLFNKGSLIISGRRTYFDLIANRMTDSKSAYPFCYDLNAKLDYDINRRHRLTFRAMQNHESTELLSEIADNVDLNESAKTNMLGIKWDFTMCDNLALSTVFSGYRDVMTYHSFKTDSLIEQYNYERQFARISNFTVKEKLDWRFRKDFHLTAGLSFSYIHPIVQFYSQPRNFYYARNEFPGMIRFNDIERYSALFAEATYFMNADVQIKYGVRYDYSHLVHAANAAPRFSFLYHINNSITFDGSWGIVYQFPDPQAIYTRDQPLNFSYNLNNIDAEKATHTVLGVTGHITENYKAKLTLYHKDIDRLLLPMDDVLYIPANNGRGVSQGMECVLEKKPLGNARFSGVVSYALANSRYYHIADHQWKPFNYDRRHTLTLYSDIRLWKKLTFSALYRFGSGLPYTPINSVMIYAAGSEGGYYNDWDFVRSARNSGRLSNYQRLDIRFSWRHSSGDRFFSVYLDIINVTNHANVYNMTWEKVEPDENVSDDEIAGFKQARRRVIYMLPFLPSLGVSFRL